MNLWTGAVTSTFMIDRQPVKVVTVAHPEKDAVAFRLESPLLESNRIRIRIRIPSPSGLWKDTGNRWIYGANQKSELVFRDESADIHSTIDSSSYQIQIRWNNTASIGISKPMPMQKNTYLVNGHNYQHQRLTIYLPGNGGL